jgi:hypothetical protein
MKVRFLVVTALISVTVFAQGPGGRGFGGPRNAAGKGTPPTPAQLAANQLTMIARYLKLDSAQTSALTGDTALVSEVETAQGVLQSNATTLKTAYSSLAADIAAGNTGDEAKQESTIETTDAAGLQARATLAAQILAALPGLGITTTSTQQAGVAQMLVRGSGGRFR